MSLASSGGSEIDLFIRRAISENGSTGGATEGLELTPHPVELGDHRVGRTCRRQSCGSYDLDLVASSSERHGGSAPARAHVSAAARHAKSTAALSSSSSRHRSGL